MAGAYPCLGCDKSFNTRRQLHSHEPRCQHYQQLKSNLTHSHKRLKTARDVPERTHPQPCFESSVVDSEDDVGPSTFSDAMFADMPPDEAGPSRLTPNDIPMPSSDTPHSTVVLRSRRTILLPARYRDYLATRDDSSISSSYPSSPNQIPRSPSPQTPPPLVNYTTARTNMAIFRIYSTRPTFKTKGDGDIDSAVDAPTLEVSHHPQGSAGDGAIHSVSQITRENLYSAFSSPAAGLFMCWQYSGMNEKSHAELNRLWNFVTDPQFQPAEGDTFNHDHERKLIERYLCNESNPFRADHGWESSSVSVLLPHEGSKWRRGEHDPSVPTLVVDGVYHRSITDIIMATLQDEVAETFHLMPFEEYWQPDVEKDPIRIYGEAYSSPAFLEMYQSIHSLPQEPDDDLERVVIPIMLWSDATQLANFGDASLWPIYLFIGNQSKYTRGKPTAGACHHVAYIPKLPDDFQDVYKKHFQRPSSDDVYTHCKRELMQAIWRLLLDEKFMNAYKSGVVTKFTDNVDRRAFLRFYTYGADYPEKVVNSCTKFLGFCLCPRCLAEKALVMEMGTPADMEIRRNKIRIDDELHKTKIAEARKLIFRHGKPINGTDVKNLLGDESLVPTRSAFSERISDEEFNYFLLFVVDLLHEFELGVWKAIFTHLMRILHAVGGSAVQLLNYRYRHVPTFGRATIRQFHKNASAMKRLAARDFEDLLQCALPVFEGLIVGEHNEIILDLLFDLATWHAFAKLRLHTEQTLDLFEKATTYLGDSTRKFQRTTCAYYRTTELPQEHAARGHRTAALSAKRGRAISSTPHPKEKNLNLATYKFHALGDYVDTIRHFGTTDSYSTQLGELEHRRVKRRYPRSGKKKESMVKSIANQEAIERFIAKVNAARIKFNEEDNPQVKRTRSSPLEHYHMAQSTRSSDDIAAWLGARKDDPAFKGFYKQLKDHLLARVRGLAYDGDEHDFSEDDRYCINFKDNQIYHHALLRVNYTTYDLRREQDTVNPLLRPDVMVLSHEDERSHPYWYARVVHIFHVMVQQREHLALPYSAPVRMDVLFVRWFGRDVNYPSGWSEKRLHRFQFFDQENPLHSFGFLDPDSVVRGVHMIPAFAWGETNELLGPSQARRMIDGDEADSDWKYYFANMFADRDLFMRFRGGGVGHKATWDWNEFLLRDTGKSVDPVDDDSTMAGSESEDDQRMAEEDRGEDSGEVGMADDDLEDWERVLQGSGDESGLEEDVESDNDDPDRVIPDEGEELDDDIYANEGYGAL